MASFPPYPTTPSRASGVRNEGHKETNMTALINARQGVLTKTYAPAGTLNGHTLTFREDGWFNMTKAAKAFGKPLGNFWVAKDTRAYLEEVTRLEAPSLKSSEAPTPLFFANKGRNPGTWAHPKLAVFFAR
jgi:hypothetical protein